MRKQDSPRLSKFTGFLLNISPATWIYYCNKVSFIQILMTISYAPKSGTLKSNKSVYFDSLGLSCSEFTQSII